MCGIAGFIGKRKISKDCIDGTLGLMRNRGPDNREYAVFNDSSNSVALLHSRLSIIDLDKRSNQPFTIGEYTIVFNGEIYNYLELREELEKRGISFKTGSDTEVLLQSYITFGEECVKRFEGMWAFAIYDRKKAKLFLSRDRFAEKPLYYLESPDGVYFGSEIKFIRALSGADLSVNTQHLLRYLINGYKALYKQNETFFNEIKEVPFASNFVIDNDLRSKIYTYWTPVCKIKDMTLYEAVEGFRHHLRESIKIRLRSDVPLAFSLSGGVDSGVITSLAKKVLNYDVASFSIIDSDKRYNEYDNICATVKDLGCRHTIIDIPQDGLFGRLEKLIRYHDAPVYTISYYIQSFIIEAIAKSGYKVVVAGSAADEMVSGYYDHFNLYLNEMRDRPDFPRHLQDWEGKVKPFVRNPYLKNPRLYFDDPSFRAHIYLNNDAFTEYLKVDFDEGFTEKDYCQDSMFRNRMMNELFHENVPPILHEDDLNSMFYSIENRSPYLDSKLFQFAYSIPTEYLIQDGYGKYILRESAKGILNEKVRTDRQKKGFNASINSLVDFSKKENRDFFLSESEIFKFVKKERIEELFSIYPMPNSLSKFLFYFLNAKMFLELNA